MMTDEEIKKSDNVALSKLVEHYQYFVQNTRRVLTNIDFIPLVVSELSIVEVKKIFGYERVEVMSRPLDTTAFYNNLPPVQLQMRKKLIYQALREHKEVKWIRTDPNLWGKNEFMSCLSTLTPLRNPVTNNVIAFDFFVQVVERLENVVFSKSSFNLKQSNLSVSAMTLGLLENPHNLTQLQHEVLFMFCNKFNIKEIQDRLEIIYQQPRSTDSVRQIIKGLIKRFELNNREELLNFANKCGYDSQIPVCMLSVEFVKVN